jgi:hypothetical protein
LRFHSQAPAPLNSGKLEAAGTGIVPTCTQQILIVSLDTPLHFLLELKYTTLQQLISSPDFSWVMVVRQGDLPLGLASPLVRKFYQRTSLPLYIQLRDNPISRPTSLSSPTGHYLNLLCLSCPQSKICCLFWPTTVNPDRPHNHPETA